MPNCRVICNAIFIVLHTNCRNFFAAAIFCRFDRLYYIFVNRKLCIHRSIRLTQNGDVFHDPQTHEVNGKSPKFLKIAHFMPFTRNIVLYYRASHQISIVPLKISFFVPFFFFWKSFNWNCSQCLDFARKPFIRQRISHLPSSVHHHFEVLLLDMECRNWTLLRRRMHSLQISFSFHFVSLFAIIAKLTKMAAMFIVHCSLLYAMYT